MLASKLAASALPLLGVPVLREGNIINLPALPLEVAEACSGIRSLLSLTTLSVIYGYLLESRISIRTLLMLASIPIAVVANGLRIVGTGLLVQYWGQDAAEGFFHTFSGWLVFVVSLILLFALHQLFFSGTPGEGEAVSHWRFTITLILLAGTGVFLQGRKHIEILPSREPLAQFLTNWERGMEPM